MGLNVVVVVDVVVDVDVVVVVVVGGGGSQDIADTSGVTGAVTGGACWTPSLGLDYE